MRFVRPALAVLGALAAGCAAPPPDGTASLRPRPEVVERRKEAAERPPLATSSAPVARLERDGEGAAEPGSSRAALEAPHSSPEAPLPAGAAPVRLPESGALGESDRGLGRLVPDDQALVSISTETLVRAAPSPRAKRIGYLRAGARVARGVAPVGHEGCPGGWYAISPEGFVCAGTTASLDPRHPVARALTVRPDRTAPLPYAYGLSRSPAPPLYVKVPSRAEQETVEPWLRGQPRVAAGWQDVEFGAVPAFLQDGQRAHSLNGYRHAAVFVGRALPRSGFALVGYFEAEGRRFGVSADLNVLPLDRLQRVEGSRYHGLELPAPGLPAAIVRRAGGLLYRGDLQAGERLTPERPLRPREVLALSGEQRRVGGVLHLGTRDGGWVREEGLLRVERRRSLPGWAKPGVRWLEVDILRQLLIAWEGDRAVYLTLVSTGVGGLGDPEKTRATPRGQFRIHTKHVTATMSGDEMGDEYELRDVPWVQYFSGGYALHAAYWHDAFGTPRSHGCVNLAPADARWLFAFTDPPVPEAWHGAISGRGTRIWIH